MGERTGGREVHSSARSPARREKHPLLGPLGWYPHISTSNPHVQEDTMLYVVGECGHWVPLSVSQTHLCHGGRWALQDGLRQQLLGKVTGR